MFSITHETSNGVLPRRTGCTREVTRGWHAPLLTTSLTAGLPLDRIEPMVRPGRRNNLQGSYLGLARLGGVFPKCLEWNWTRRSYTADATLLGLTGTWSPQSSTSFELGFCQRPITVSVFFLKTCSSKGDTCTDTWLSAIQHCHPYCGCICSQNSNGMYDDLQRMLAVRHET